MHEGLGLSPNTLLRPARWCMSITPDWGGRGRKITLAYRESEASLKHEQHETLPQGKERRKEDRKKEGRKECRKKESLHTGLPFTHEQQRKALVGAGLL